MVKDFFKYQIASWMHQFLISGKLMQTNLIIPYYHLVSDDEILHIKYLYDHKNIKQFIDDLDFLLKKYSPISLINLLDYLKRGILLPKNALLLTFDDGFREIHDIVAPILLQKGISATIFVNSAFTDNKILCYQHKASILAEHIQKISGSEKENIKEVLSKDNILFGDIKSGILAVKYSSHFILDKIALLIDVDFEAYLSRNRPYLTSDQIKRLITEGFTVGAHSIDHPLYSLLTLEEQLFQTIKSLKFVKETFNLKYGAFAFPHSDNGVTKEFFTQIYGSGLVDISFGTGGMIKDAIPNHFQRFSLEKPVIPAKKIIAYQYARKLVRQVRGDGEIKRT